MSDSGEEFVVYYSDIGLEQHGALKHSNRVSPMSHRARIKALLLLSDAVHIPLSHLLSLSSDGFSQIVGGCSQFFADSMIRFRLSSSAPDLHSYIGAFGERSGKESLIPTLNIKERMFNENGIRPQALTYSGSNQTSLLKAYIGNKLEQWGSRSQFSDADLAFLHTALEESESKEGFDHLLKAGYGRVDAEAIKSAKELSDVFYYFVGAETNETVMSANAFLSQKRLLRLGIDNLNGMPFSGDLYDPLMFGVALKAMRAINELDDFDCLTLQDIKDIKDDPRYRFFIEQYRELYKSSANCADMIMRIKGEHFIGSTVTSLIGILIVSAVAGNMDAAAVLKALNGMLEVPIGEAFKIINQLVGTVGILDIGSKALKAFPVKDSRLLAENIVFRLGYSVMPMHHMAELVESFMKNKLV